MGIRIPVDTFPPKTSAIKVTTTTPIPLMPDFPTPRKKAAVKARTRSRTDMSKLSGKVVKSAIYYNAK
jgi:hypothetical protein